MKPNFPSRLARVCAVVVIAALGGKWAVSAVQDKREVTRMTQKMKTVCVGRLLIDMPEGARVELGRVAIDGLDIASFEEPDEEFQARLAAREAQIRARPDRLGGNKNMESAREVRTASGFAGRIFVHSRTVTEGTQANGLELERYRYEAVDVEALVHANGVSIDLMAEGYDPDLIENLPKLVNQLVPNRANRMPTEPGFCFNLAYVRDPLTAEQGEQLTMFALLPSHPDIAFRLIYATGNKPARYGLLERHAASVSQRSLAESLHFTTLRAAPRVIGGLPGDELVEKVVEDNSAVVYSLEWEVNGTEDNVYHPHLLFEMDTGKGKDGPVQSSLSQGAALGLWDKITSSIRIRTTTPPKTSAAEPLSTPLGTQARAGDTCPQSGWWQCHEGGDGTRVLGGQRQYINQGQRMPQAQLLAPQTLWEKIRGLQSSYEASTPTSWQLVDKRSRKRAAPVVSLEHAVAAAPAATMTAESYGPTGSETLAAVGRLAQTGLPCPASGWWQCEEPQALDGTRWFEKGSLLPAATFAVPTGRPGRAATILQTIQRRGAWRLVRLDAGA